VRLVTDAGWTDAEIRNVSSRGLMAICTSPPVRGSYVELRHRSYSVVGRVVWSAEGHFGIQAQQTLSLPDLLHPPSRINLGTGERRQSQRAQVRFQVRRATVQERAAESGRRGRAIEFFAILATVIAFAYIVADQALRTLAPPLKTTAAALSVARAKTND
jgi:hypothetical protein